MIFYGVKAEKANLVSVSLFLLEKKELLFYIELETL